MKNIKDCLSLFVIIGFLTFAIASSDDATTTTESETTESVSDTKIEKSFWEYDSFVDEFGDATNEGFLYNSEVINGSFSNSATDDSKLYVNFLISDDGSIAIQLHEYRNPNLVKAYSKDYYSVKIKDEDGEIHSLSAFMRKNSDRIEFKNNKKLHNLLLTGKSLTFSIKEKDSLTSYKFKLENHGDEYSRQFDGDKIK